MPEDEELPGRGRRGRPERKLMNGVKKDMGAVYMLDGGDRNR